MKRKEEEEESETEEEPLPYVDDFTWYKKDQKEVKKWGKQIASLSPSRQLGYLAIEYPPNNIGVHQLKWLFELEEEGEGPSLNWKEILQLNGKRVEEDLKPKEGGQEIDPPPKLNPKIALQIGEQFQLCPHCGGKKPEKENTTTSYDEEEEI
jgi:hypothetical protein